MQLKLVNEQVVAILGVSCSIRRETVLQFAKQGANLVVAVRSQAGLNLFVDEISRIGSNAVPVVAEQPSLNKSRQLKKLKLPARISQRQTCCIQIQFSW